MKRKQCKQIAAAIATRRYRKAIRLIDIELNLMQSNPKLYRINWERDLLKLKSFLKNGIPMFSIFAKDGNGKLPFLAFSSMPGKGFCVGAGDCLKWCYSFRAWRYPAAFCRQIQNAVLLQSASGRNKILLALDEFKPKLSNPEWVESLQETIDFRLYVDGDFTGISDIKFWMESLADRQWLKAYGYSKSWQAFLDYDGDVPSNYLLNLSSGSKYSDIIKDKLKAFSFVRGEFKAISVGYKVQTKDHSNRAHQKRLREAYGSKAFTCAGLCGSCTKLGHACGSDRFNGIDIIIAVH
jgi:hypothetical protein